MKRMRLGVFALVATACVGALVVGPAIAPTALAGGGATVDVKTIEGTHTFWIYSPIFTVGSGPMGLSAVGTLTFDGNGNVIGGSVHGQMFLQGAPPLSVDLPLGSGPNSYSLVDSGARVYELNGVLFRAEGSSGPFLVLNDCRLQLLDSRGTAGRLTARFTGDDTASGFATGVAMGETKSQ